MASLDVANKYNQHQNLTAKQNVKPKQCCQIDKNLEFFVKKVFVSFCSKLYFVQNKKLN